MARPTEPDPAQLAYDYGSASSNLDVRVGCAVPSDWLATSGMPKSGYLGSVYMARRITTTSSSRKTPAPAQQDIALWSTTPAEELDYAGDPVAGSALPDWTTGVKGPFDDNIGTNLWELLPGYMSVQELAIWHATHRPAEPAPNQVAGIADVVVASVRYHPLLADLPDVPAEWTRAYKGEYDDNYGTYGPDVHELLPGYMTPDEFAAYNEAGDDGGDGGDDDAGALATRVLDFAGMESTPELTKLVTAHLPVVTAQVRAYTRGRGFNPDTLDPDSNLTAVIISTCVRSASNPSGETYVALDHLRYRPGTYSGWTLPELAILHTYRRRSA